MISSKANLFLENLIHKTAFLCFMILAFYGFFTAVADQIPVPPATDEPVSCDGRRDCHEQDFQIDNGRKARCAFWENEYSHCVVLTR